MSFTRKFPLLLSLIQGLLEQPLLLLPRLLPLLAEDRISLRLREIIFSANPFIPALQVLTRGIFDDLGELWRAHLPVTLGAAGVFLVIA